MSDTDLLQPVSLLPWSDPERSFIIISSLPPAPHAEPHLLSSLCLLFLISQHAWLGHGSCSYSPHWFWPAQLEKLPSSHCPAQTCKCSNSLLTSPWTCSLGPSSLHRPPPPSSSRFECCLQSLVPFASGLLHSVPFVWDTLTLASWHSSVSMWESRWSGP